MNLFDRIRGTRRLAEQQQKPEVGVETGVSGDFTSLYNKEEARSDTVTIADYKKMLDNDGTVEAIYNMITWPIKGADFHFDVEAGGDAELQLVEDNFMLPQHKGGMSMSFDILLGDMLRAIAEGFRLYEKVWQLQDGKYVYRKIAPRNSETITLKRDSHGGFDGAAQRTWNGSEYIDVTIPLNRSFLYTYGKDRSFLYGRSAFKSAHYHYDRKHKLYYLEQLGAQTGAVPPRKLKVPAAVANNQSKLDAAEAAADNFGVMQRITLPDGYDLEEYKTTPMDLTKSIDHQDSLIARSVLAQFLVLGQQGTGSYSLSKDQSSLFIEALQGTMKQIEHHINSYLIPDLINYNFGSGRYPEFHFEDLDKTKKSILGEAFKTILSRDDIPGYVIEGIAQQMADELGIETENVVSSDDGKTEKTDASEHLGSVQLAETFSRQLTDAEKRVNLSDLVKKTQTAEERLLAETSAFFLSVKDDATSRLRKLLEKGDYAGLKTFKLGSFAPYRKALETAMMEQYLYGKRTAADEVGGKIPQTPSKSRTYVTQQAKAVADKQEADLLFIVKNEATKELRSLNLDDRQLSISDVLARIAAAVITFTEKNVEPGIAVSLFGSLNLGRGDSFGASDDIDRMQYSAILDNRTSPMCRDLDNSVVTYESYRATQWVPPCHFRCRSIWVAILKDDAFKPDYQPIPAAPGGHSAPQLHDYAAPVELAEAA